MFRRLSRLLFTELHTHRPLRSKLAIPTTLILGFATLLWYQYTRYSPKRSRIAGVAYCASKGEDSLRTRMNFLADVCEEVLPSVVSITSSGTRSSVLGAVVRSGGSGVIVHESGLVLTNAHVTGGARSVSVRLHNNRVLKGHVVVVDQLKDLALIRLIVKQKLPALKLVTTQDLRDGEMVLALGSPLTLANTITSGIVSQANRRSDELGLKGEMSYIQTDAAITEGNSGGPLVNLDGEVIGINTLTAGPGVSFAIPSDYAIQMMHKFSSNKVAIKPEYHIGIQMMSLTPQLIQSLVRRSAHSHLNEVTEGVLIASVNSHSPAYQAGLQGGDVITRVNGTVVRTVTEVLECILKGKSMKLGIIRRNSDSYIFINVKPEIVNWVD